DKLWYAESKEACSKEQASLLSKVGFNLEGESQAQPDAARALITIRLPVQAAVRIRSPRQAGKAAAFELVQDGPNLSVQDLVQDLGQRLGIRIVIRVDVTRRNGIRRPIPGGAKGNRRILVEDVQDVEVKRHRVTLLDLVTVR